MKTFVMSAFAVVLVGAMASSVQAHGGQIIVYPTSTHGTISGHGLGVNSNVTLPAMHPGRGNYNPIEYGYVPAGCYKVCFTPDHHHSCHHHYCAPCHHHCHHHTTCKTVSVYCGPTVVHLP